MLAVGNDATAEQAHREIDVLRLETFKKAIAMGTIVASFTVEDFGLDSLRRVRREDFEERLALFKKICSF